MSQPSKTILQKADFNPKIRSYFLTYGAFVLTISIIGIPLLPFWLLGIGQVISRRFYDNLVCTLTPQHLEFKKGAFFKVEKTIPLENIQDLTFIENPVLSFFDLRILKIETAGQSNPQGSDMKLIGIMNTQAFKEQVLLQREHLKSRESDDRKPSNSKEDQMIGLLQDIKEILLDMKDKSS